LEFAPSKKLNYCIGNPFISRAVYCGPATRAAVKRL
jgi:hypothetical protein